MFDLSATEKYMYRNLKIKHLHLLVELADRKHVGKVAASMCVTQPAVSKMLAELETGLGVTLFERAGRGIRPTAYGESMIRHARGVLLGMQSAHEEMRALAGDATGRIAIGMLGVATSSLMPHALRLFKKTWPGVTVSLREDTMDRHLPELRAGKLDLVVGRLVAELADDDLVTEALFEDPVTIVAAADHPLTARKELRWQDLNGWAWVLPPEGAPMRDRLLALLTRYKVAMPGNVIESVSLLTNLSLFTAYPVLGLLPQSMARHYAAAGTLRILPLNMGQMIGPVGMIWSRERLLAPAVRSMQICLRDACKTIAQSTP